MRRAGRPWSFDSNSFATDNLLLVPNFSPVPPNMLTTSCWRARASSPMALNSPVLNGFDGMSHGPKMEGKPSRFCFPRSLRVRRGIKLTHPDAESAPELIYTLNWTELPGLSMLLFNWMISARLSRFRS